MERVEVQCPQCGILYEDSAAKPAPYFCWLCGHPLPTPVRPTR